MEDLKNDVMKLRAKIVSLEKELCEGKEKIEELEKKIDPSIKDQEEWMGWTVYNRTSSVFSDLVNRATPVFSEIQKKIQKDFRSLVRDATAGKPLASRKPPAVKIHRLSNKENTPIPSVRHSNRFI